MHLCRGVLGVCLWESKSSRCEFLSRGALTEQHVVPCFSVVHFSSNLSPPNSSQYRCNRVCRWLLGMLFYGAHRAQWIFLLGTVFVSKACEGCGATTHRADSKFRRHVQHTNTKQPTHKRRAEYAKQSQNKLKTHRQHLQRAPTAVVPRRARSHRQHQHWTR